MSADKWIATLRRQPDAEAVEHAAEGSAESVPETPRAGAVRPQRREGPPPTAEVRLHLEELAARRQGPADHVPAESDRLAVSDRLAIRPDRTRGSHPQTEIRRGAADAARPGIAEQEVTVTRGAHQVTELSTRAGRCQADGQSAAAGGRLHRFDGCALDWLAIRVREPAGEAQRSPVRGHHVRVKGPG